MECLVAIGTPIVTKIAELTVAPIIRQVGYTIHYNENLKKLKNQVGELSRARESMQHSVETEERKGNKIEEGVQFWLKEVDQLTKQVDDFMKDEHHAATKCLRGFCPNLKLRHRLSRKSTKLGLEVAELEKKNNFANIAYAASPEEVCTIAIQDYEAFDSRTSTAEDVINELRKSDTYMIGVYGIGGVGKTTLVKEVYKQAKSGEKLFDEVVIVLDLKQNPSIEQIQKAISEKLGLELSEAGTEGGRARQICNRIKDKKTLVILDDVWENIDLEAVGLPRMATLKLLLTSRSKLVLASEMGTQKEFHLEVLNQEESWSLFQKMAGDIVEKPEIQTIAAQVSEKCGGLPLLIVTVARALKDSSLHEWKDTFRRLKKFDGKGLTEKTSSAIEWSYNKLESEELKSVFLLCASEFVSNNYIPIRYSLYLCMALGIIKDADTLEEAWDALHTILKKLQHSCLLQDDSVDNQWIRIHDLVRDVATNITTRDHHVLSVSHGSELKKWPDTEFSKKCTRISLKQCNTPEFPEVLQCPELTMFQLSSVDDDLSREIPSNFFKEMKKLKVLDITYKSVPSLPSSLIWLKDLQTLCLDSCTLGDIALVGELQNLKILSFLNSKFHKLPEEIGQLSRLVLLELTNCSQLEVISPNVISRLKRLEELRMGKNSFNKWEAKRAVDTNRSNASLEELKYLHRLTSLQIHIPDANILPADLFTGSKLQRFQICIGSVWKWDDVDEALNALKLQLTTSNEMDQGLKMLLEKTKDLYVEGVEGVKDRFFRELATRSYQQLKHLHVHKIVEFGYTINETVGFSNLTWLAVSELNSLRFLFSFSMAKSLSQLKRLHITGCQIMEEVISIEESNEDFPESILCQLQELELKGLPNLTKFCSRSCVEVPNLSCQRLQLEDSIESSTTCEEIEEIDSKGSLDMVVQHFLFDNKVAFPNLKTLSIDGLAKLMTIWNNNLSLEGSSLNLETVEIVSCDNLKSIFPASLAKSLQQLRRLKVYNCGVEEIISKEKDVQTTPMFVFRKLTYLFFQKLPRLRSFYPGLHSSKWVSLVALAVYGCTNVQIFAKRGIESNNVCTPNKQYSLFSLEEESFPNLESFGFGIMENWDSPPLHMFRKLKSLYVYAHTNSSVDSLEKLLGFRKVNGEIYGVGDGTFPHLSELHLYGMRKLINLGDDKFGPASPYFPKVKLLRVEDCDSLKNLRSSAISFENLTTLQVSRCKGLKYLISFSVAKSLVQLTKLQVGDCEEMMEIVASSGNDDSVNEIEFRVLKHLELSVLPSMRGFCSATCIVKFPSLENLSVSSCTQLEAFIFNADIPESSEAQVVQRFLFDNKVELPRLESLSLKGITKLTTIWHSQLSLNSFSRLKDLRVQGCANLASIFVPSTMGRLNALATLIIRECESLRVVFQLEELDIKQIQDTSPSTQLKSFHCENLDSVEIYYCESLINIFPVSVATNLTQLRKLIVMSCGVKEIVAREDGLQTIPKFVFPKATRVLFDNLPQLTSFYPEMHGSSWPMLNNLEVNKCLEVNTLVDEISSFHGYDQHEHLCSSPIPPSLFSIDKDSFHNLEVLVFEGKVICKGPLQVHLFSKLKHLDVAGLQSKSAVFLKGNSTTINSAVGIGTHQQQQWQLPHLKQLRLGRLEKLMHLGQEDEEDNNSQSVPNIPYLEILLVNGCDSLRNLRSSAISFHNLTTLKVSVCSKLEYLITYSMANSLTQLTTLEVIECPRLVEIVGSNEDGDSRKEITFRRLKHLKLSGLPRLQGFCSKDCIVKFPSMETATMSNRLNLKIFTAHGQTILLTNEEGDTDVDRWEEYLAAEDEKNTGTD